MKNNISDLINIQKIWFSKGKTSSASFRIKQLLHLKDMLLKNKRHILYALKKDTGQSNEECYFSELLPLLNLIKAQITLLKKNKNTFMPRGVALIIAPATQSFLSSLSFLISAVAAGNTVFLKPSQKAYYTYEAINKMISEYFPASYIYVLPKSLSYDDFTGLDYDFVFFAGKKETVPLLKKEFANQSAPVSINTGNKNFVYIASDADLKEAANSIVFSKSINCGQTHFAPDIITVNKKLHKKFLAYLISEIEDQLGSDPLVNEGYPKMINKDYYDRLLNMSDSEKSVYGGAKCIETLQIGSIVMDNLSLDDACMQEEILGPLYPVVAVNNFKEAINIVETFGSIDIFYIFSAKIVYNKLKRFSVSHFIFNQSYYTYDAKELLNMFAL